MTTVSSSSGSTTVPPRGPQSPLVMAIEEQPALVDLLTGLARSHTLNRDEAKDIVSGVMLTAMERERRGEGWDPNGRFTIRRYLVAMLFDGLNNWRRSKRRNRAIPVGDASDLASSGLEPEGSLVSPHPESEEDENRKLDGLEEAIRAFFADETDGHIPIGIMDLRIQGVRSHAEIAVALKCSPEEVKRGYDRLAHHAKRIAGIGKKKGRPS